MCFRYEAREEERSLVIRCQSADKSLIQWAAMHLKLEQSEVIRQGIRIGIPMLVNRMRQLTRKLPRPSKFEEHLSVH
jgi:hypothetical protein